MSTKRGRPVSDDVSDLLVARRREAWRRQRQNHRNRTATLITPAQISDEQLQQGESVINFTPTEDEAAAATLIQLGLRVQGVTLAQDANNAQNQNDAQPVDEETTLYPPTYSPQRSQLQTTTTIATTPKVGFFRQFINRSNAEASSSRQSQSQLSQFFTSLPPKEPSILRPTPNSSRPHPVSSPSHEAICSTPSNHPSLLLSQYDTFDLSIPPADRPIEQKEMEQAEDLRSEREATNNNGDIQLEDNDAQPSLEQSVHSDQSSSEASEISAYEYTVQKLYQQFQSGFHGCSEQQHTDQLHQHTEAAGDNHYGLRDLSNDETFPSVLGLSEMISPERLGRQQMPTRAQWRDMYCGIPQNQRHHQPKNICLHKEETQPIQPDVAFDIDSFLGFATSLAMAKKGLWYQPVPQMRQNVKNDIHLETHVFQIDEEGDTPIRSTMAMLRSVPHFLLGRVEGAHDITVHVLFPHMSVTGEKFISLTEDQLARWTDQVYLPALHTFYAAHYMQHLPASFHHSVASSKAHQVEGRLVETASYQAQQSLGYHLQPEHLNQIWSNILHRVQHTPGLADFREPQLFFSAKGTKLQFKTNPSRPTLPDTMEHFQAYLQDIINLDFVQLDRFFVDLGKEICPQTSQLASDLREENREAQVYSWKRCCLEQYMQWMYNDQPPTKDGPGQRYYDQNMLYDACGLTSLTPKRSQLREGGLIYSQFYGSVKEIVDAAKSFPFQNDGMEEMALDPQIRQGARHAAGGRRRDGRIVERAYLASKRRTREALRSSRQKSFGIREEHRVSWSLFQGLLDELQLKERSTLAVAIAPCPSYIWAIRTDQYMDYLWRTADKFATGFEIIRAQCRQEMYTWEQTKMMAMFLRCLRFVFGGHLLRRESTLWWSRRERASNDSGRTQVWIGLGFSKTLLRHKYCWLEPRFDWRQLAFKSEITDSVLFGNGVLRGQYLRRGGQVQAFFDMTQRLELALRLLDQAGEQSFVQQRVVLWIAHICLQQFRIDVLQNVKQEIAEEHRQKAVLGQIGFCFEYLSEIMIQAVNLTAGNRSEMKHVDEVTLFLFEYGDGLQRKHWEDRPFRKIYRRARTALQIRGDDIAEAFAQAFLDALHTYHWVLPYPEVCIINQFKSQGLDLLD